jgi:predicted dehydrogenase
MTLAVGIAGCGYFSQFHRDAWSRLPGARVVGVCDADPAKAQAAAASLPGARPFTDAAAMLDATRPDVMDMVTPPSSRAALLALAAERKIAVIAQKPLADDLAGARALVARANQAGIALLVHENFRFMPWFQEARRIIEGGRLGRVLNLSYRFRPGDGQGPDAYLSRQPYFQTMPRFLVHEVFVHLFDTFRFLLGEVLGLAARLKRHNPAIAGEDTAVITLEFANGATGLLDGNRLLDHPSDDPRMTGGTLLVEGTDATLRLDGFGRLFLRAHRGDEREHAYAWDRRGFGGDAVYRTIEHLASHLTQGTPTDHTAEKYLHNVVLVEAAYASAREGRFVTV